jgi:hypothetical protein
MSINRVDHRIKTIVDGPTHLDLYNKRGELCDEIKRSLCADHFLAFPILQKRTAMNYTREFCMYIKKTRTWKVLNQHRRGESFVATHEPTLNFLCMVVLFFFSDTSRWINVTWGQFSLVTNTKASASHFFFKSDAGSADNALWSVEFNCKKKNKKRCLHAGKQTQQKQTSWLFCCILSKKSCSSWFNRSKSRMMDA